MDREGIILTSGRRRMRAAVRWTKRIVPFLLVGGVYLHFFSYIDLLNDCRISIRMSLFEFSNLTVKDAIGVIKRALPREYRDLCANVSTIDPNFSCGGFGGGCYSTFTFEKEGRTIDVSTAKDDILWTAGVIVHETCHAMQYHEKRSFSEAECYSRGYKAIAEIVRYQ
jgi:hypothetical protein